MSTNGQRRAAPRAKTPAKGRSGGGQAAVPAEGPGALDAPEASALVAAASDIALVLDAKGVIQEISCPGGELAQEGFDKWIGGPWADSVNPDSRSKVEALLADAAVDGPRRWRHVNQHSFRGADVPILYATVQTGRAGRIVAFGRDLRPVAALQQRLLEAQQAMERDYWRLRNAETRYRLLFQSSAEAVLVVDAATGKVTEANPAAEALLGEPAKRLVGRAFVENFEPAAGKSIHTLLAAVLAVGDAEPVKVRHGANRRELTVAASTFRQENTAFHLVRLTPVRAEAAGAPGFGAVIKVLENAPDGFVVTDLDGHIVTANAAFAEMAQSATLERLVGEPLERYLGRTGVECGVLIGNLRQHGAVRLFSTVLNGQHGATADVEVSAVAVAAGELPCLGFTIRNVGRRLAGEARPAAELPRSAQQLTELVGRVPLKDIVGETADLIERLCIESALGLTRDNRASAAEMLGLSRQSLYVKLRRYGIGDLGGDGQD